MIQQREFAGYCWVLALTIVMLLLGGCSEEITITFAEDERWFAEAYYMDACTGSETTYCREMERVIREAEKLGISGTRMGETVILEGQGYDLLEVMLEKSICCHAAEIDLRTEDSESRIYFSLKEKEIEVEEMDWTITLSGGEIIRSNGTKTDEAGETQWRGYGYDSEKVIRDRPKREMIAVLTSVGVIRPPIIIPIVIALVMIGLIALMVFFGIRQRGKAFWFLVALIVPLIGLLVISINDSCSRQCVNFNPSTISLFDGTCLEYYDPDFPACTASAINGMYDSLGEIDSYDMFFIGLFACFPALFVFVIILVLGRILKFRIPFTGSRQRNGTAEPTDQLPGQENNDGEEEET
ncbi:MAG: hypothetical protein ACWGQW_10995 [bacterium]